MYITTNDVRTYGVTTRTVEWHVGEPLRSAAAVVTEIQADGDELNAIVDQGLFVIPKNNIAMPQRRVWRFFGDQAKFIIANLVTR